LHNTSICDEMTRQKQAEETLAFEANHDPTTGLPNRSYFDELLASAMQDVVGTTNCVALMYVEIDNFEFLKGTFGRVVVDEMLGEIGAGLAAFRRDGETIARLDDTVFGMMMTAASFDEASVARGNELLEQFHRVSDHGKHRIPVLASIGITFSSEGAKGSSLEAETLVKLGRAAMLEVRSRGGDAIFVADPALKEKTTQQQRIEAALLTGLRDDEFRVEYQPVFEVASGKLVRFEALCRWTSAALGPIPPARFLPIAEQTGLIKAIRRRIFDDALRQAKLWRESGQKIGISVNISPMQFIRPDFIRTVSDALAAAQVPASVLELEITEGIFIRDLNVAVARIRELQRMGVSVALDDFGSGYSSLSYLQRMPIDAVKLDRTMLADLTTEASTVTMVQSVMAMASDLNLRVVAECVDSEEQLEILRLLGCDEAQGFLLGRPESAELAMKRVMEGPVRAMAAMI
jgi:diguanylate cyclase (GGDEF)-like protein